MKKNLFGDTITKMKLKWGAKRGFASLMAVLMMLGVTSCGGTVDSDGAGTENSSETSAQPDDIPEYAGEPFVAINDNEPFFTEDEMTTESFETYSELDSLGRCGAAFACVGQDIMPTKKRGDISAIKPTGWINKDYPNVDGGRLYNRCHLLGHQLTGEDANEKNLITGTRYMNVDGMLPFENMVADYVKETGNHVMYRVTPVFEGDDLVAKGVLMEAKSVEDDGEGVLYNVFCYNNQPDVVIDYATGDNWAEGKEPQGGAQAQGEEGTYILNTNSMKFHRPDCPSAKKMSEHNKEEFTGTRQELIDAGYEPCGSCNP